MGIVRIVIHYSIIFAFQSKVKLFCARLKKKDKKAAHFAPFYGAAGAVF